MEKRKIISNKKIECCKDCEFPEHKNDDMWCFILNMKVQKHDWCPSFNERE